MSFKLKTVKDLVLSFWIPIVLILLWWVSASYGWINPYLLPPPENVWKAFIELIKEGELYRHISSSLYRSLGGYFLAVCIAFPLAYLFAKSQSAHQQGRIVLESLRMIPPLSLIPLLILWLGIGETAKIAIVLLASFFPIYLNAYSGFKQLDYRYGELAIMLKLSRWERIKHIEFPGALPSIFTGLRLGFGYSWRALVSAELIAASSGLGYLISDASEMARTDQVFVGILTIAVLGIVGDILFQYQMKKFAPWSQS